jgi:hypothetical protein
MRRIYERSQFISLYYTKLQFAISTPPTGNEIEEIPNYQPTLLQFFIRGSPFRETAGLIPTAEAWFKRSLTTSNPQALVIYVSL